MRYFRLFAALCALCLHLLATAVLATIDVFGHQQVLSDTTIARPGDQVTIYSVRLANDGASALEAITLTLSDLSTPTGIASGNIDRLQLYLSTDAAFETSGDSLVGVQTEVALSTPTAVSLDVPLTFSGFPYFFITASLNTVQTDEVEGAKNAFRVGTVAGYIRTSDGDKGSTIAASDDDRVTIDVVASQIAFAALPDDPTATNGDVVNGRVFATQPLLEARDAHGNVDVEHGGTATLAVQTGDVALAGTLAAAWSGGRASFSGLSLTGTVDGGSFSLRASDGALTAATSSILTNDVVASQIAFTVPPGDPTAVNGDVVNGRVFSTQPILEARDGLGLRDLHAGGTVALSAASGDVALGGTATKSWVSGRADFAGSGLEMTAGTDGATSRLTAQSGALTGQSAVLVVDVVADRIAFAAASADTGAVNGDVVNGREFSTQPILEARDGLGVRDVDYGTGSASLSVSSGDVALAGTATRSWSSGRATFSGLSVSGTTDGETFVLQAGDGSLLSTTTGNLVVDAVADRIAFTSLPADAGAANGDVVNGGVFAVQPILEARDGLGVRDVDYGTGSASLSVSSGDVALAGTATRSWSSGRATFSGLSVSGTTDGETFVLQAGDGSLLSTTTGNLVMDAVADRIAFTSLPADAGAANGDVVNGRVFVVQPILEARDGLGVRDVDYGTGSASLSVSSGDVALAGTATRSWSSGRVTFSGLSVSGSVDGSRFALRGSDGSLSPATTEDLVLDAVADRVAFTSLPADASAVNGDVVNGRAFATQPVLEARDGLGARDVDYGTGSASLSVSSGDVALAGTATRSWSSGRAFFSSLSASGAADGESFVLEASGGLLAAVLSAPLVLDAVADRISFVVSPADTGAANGDVVNGRAFSTQPVLEARDSLDVRDVDYGTGSASLSVSSGDVALAGTATRSWSSGRATFSGLSVSGSVDGSRFALRGSDGSLSPATTEDLVLDAVADRVAFTSLPADASAVNGDVVNGRAFSTQPVLEARDSLGVRDVDYGTGSASLSVSSGDVALAGTATRSWSSGRAFFSSLSASSAADGENFVLEASGGLLTAVLSAPLVLDAVADRFSFAVSPADTGAANGDVVNGRAFSTQPVLEARDSLGVRDADYGTGSASLSVSSGDVSLLGTATQPWSGGRATFLDLSASGAVDGLFFALRGSDGSLPPVTTSDLVLDVVADRIGFAASPADTGAVDGDVVNGREFSTQPVVEARDGLGVRDVDYQGDDVDLTVSSGDISLVGNTSHSWISGRATFSGLSATGSVDGESFVLEAGNGGLLAASSASLTLDVVADRIAFSVLPSDMGAVNGDVVNGRVFATQPILEARDGLGVRDGDYGTGSANLSASSGDVVLSGSVVGDWSAGQVSFSGLSIAGATDGELFALSVSDGRLTPASAEGLVVDAVATGLVFGTLPSDGDAVNGDVVSGRAFAVQPVVEGRDDAGVLDVDFADAVSLSVSSSGELVGTTTVSAVEGRVEFADVGYTATVDGETFRLVADDEAGGGEGDLGAVETVDSLVADVVATRIAVVEMPGDPSAVEGDVVNGRIFPRQPSLEARDGLGGVDVDVHGEDVVLTVASGDVELAGTAVRAWNRGRVSFADLSVTGLVDGETFVLGASDETRAAAVLESLTLDVVADRIAFSVLPSDMGAVNGDVVNGRVFATQPILEARDGLGVRDGDYGTGSANLSASSGDVVLSGSVVGDWSAGQVSFSGLSIAGATDGELFALSVSDGRLTPASAEGLVVDAVATGLVFGTLPADGDAVNGDVVSGRAFAVQPVVEGRDDAGVLDVDFADAVSLSVSSSGELVGTTTVSAVEGRVEFADVGYTATVDGETFRLVADDEVGGGEGDLGAVETVDSLVADVVATEVGFGTLPADGDAVNGDVVNGRVFAVQPLVEARDSLGVLDVDYETGSVGVRVSSGDVGLSGVSSIDWDAGLGVFSELSVSGSGDGATFVLEAFDGSLTSVESGLLVADVVATEVGFGTLPADGDAVNGDVVNGRVFAVQPLVEARDSLGVLDADYETGSVGVRVSSGDVGLSGVSSIDWDAGLGVFSELSVSGSGDGTAFVLEAFAGSLTSVESGLLVADVVATALVFETLPSDLGAVNGDVVNGQVFATQPVVEARDDAGVVDVDYETGSVGVRVSSGDVVLSGVSSIDWDAGLGVFSELSVSGSGDGTAFVLEAFAGSLSSVESGLLVADVVATGLVFETLPSDGDAVNGDVVNGRVFAVQPVVEARDDAGVLDADYETGSVGVRVSSGDVVLSGASSIDWDAGLGVFADLSVSGSGDGTAFVLEAFAGSLSSVESGLLVADVVATGLVFETLPSDGDAVNGDVVNGRVFATQPVVEARDDAGVLDADYETGSVGVRVSSGDVVLSGVSSIDWDAGLGVFADLSVSGSGDGTAFVLEAFAGSLSSVESGLLVADVVATGLVFETLPSDGDAVNGDVVNGRVFATQPVVEARDDAGVLDADYETGSVGVRVSSGDVVLSGVSSIDWDAGLGVFADLSVSGSGDGTAFVLEAFAGSLSSVESGLLVADVVATGLVFETLPADGDAVNGDVVSGRAFAVQPLVEARDDAGVRDVDFVDAVSLSISSSGELSGTSTVSAVEGRVQFADLGYLASVDGESFRLLADDEQSGGEGDLPAAAGGDSLVADVVATRTVFASQPAHFGLTEGIVIHGQPFDSPPVLEAQDEAGVRDRDIDGGEIRLSVHSGNATLNGGSTGSWNSGRIHFVGGELGLEVTEDGEQVVLKAEGGGGLSTGLSDPLTVDIRATRLVFLQGPGTSGTAGSELADSEIRLAAVHQDGRLDREFADIILLDAVLTGTDMPTTVGLQTSPGSLQVPIDGVVTFGSVVYPEAGDVQLRGRGAGLTPVFSDPIRLTGTLVIDAPASQIEDQLTYGRGIVPARLPLFALKMEAVAEGLVLREFPVALELGGGMGGADIDFLQLWQDRGAPGDLDGDDRLLASSEVRDSLAIFALLDTLRGADDYLVTWSGAAPLESGWTIRGRVDPQGIVAGSTQAPSVAAVPVAGSSVIGVLHQVGSLGLPRRIALRASPDTLTADSLSRSTLTAVLVDAWGQPVVYDTSSIVSFATLNGAVLIDGPVSVQVESGEATTRLLAGTVPGSVLIEASAPGLIADTLQIVLRAGTIDRIELGADPSAVHLEQEDRVVLNGSLRDARGNVVVHGVPPVRLELSGSGRFVDGSSERVIEIDAEEGLFQVAIQVTEPGTLFVDASAGSVNAVLEIPVISTRPPRIVLSADRLAIPASGALSARLTASLLDRRDQLMAGDDSTQVRFSIASGHGLFSQPSAVVTVSQGRASIDLQGLGVAGPIVIRAEGEGLEENELEGDELLINARAAAPQRLDLVALTPQLTADGISTAVLSAVLRDSLSNVVADTAMAIRFAVAAGQAEIIGPLSVTTVGGIARTTLRSSVRAGEVEIRAWAEGLVPGTTKIELVAGSPAKLALLAVPAALPANSGTSAQLIATVLDAHGNEVHSDSTSLISFSVSGGPGQIAEPGFGRAVGGQAQGRLRIDGPPGKIVLFAGSTGLVPATFEVVVRQAQAPQFKELPAHLQLEEEGDALRLPLNALVGDADSALEDLTFLFEPDSLHFHVALEGGELLLDPREPDYAGTQILHIIARDPTGLEARGQIEVEVQAVNDAPIITSIPDSLAVADSVYSYHFQAFDPDGDKLDFRLAEGPQGMGFDRILQRAAWRSPIPGVFTVRFEVSDGQLTVEQTFRLHVLAIGGGVSIISQPDSRARRGQLYVYQPLLDNPGQQSASFRLESGPKGMRVDAQNGLVTWIPDSTASAEVEVVLSVQGEWGEIRQNFQLEVIEGNELPEILSTPPDTTWVDSLYVYRMQARHVEGDTLIFQIVSGPEGMRISPISGVVAWQPDGAAVGRTEIVLAVYDGQHTVTQSYVLQVLSTATASPPKIASLKGLVLDPAGGYVGFLQFDLLVADADHAVEALSWEVEQVAGNPVRIEYDPASREVRFTGVVGFQEAQIRLRVSDPDGLSDEHLLKLGLPAAADFTGDTAVDLDDFFTLVDAFGASPGADSWNAAVDLDGNGLVEFDDFFLFVDHYTRSNQSPAP